MNNFVLFSVQMFEINNNKLCLNQTDSAVSFHYHCCCSRVTFKTYLGVGSPQKYHIKLYIPKCLSYPEVSEITKLKCPILVRAEKSKMASKMAAFKNYEGSLF